MMTLPDWALALISDKRVYICVGQTDAAGPYDHMGNEFLSIQTDSFKTKEEAIKAMEGELHNATYRRHIVVFRSFPEVVEYEGRFFGCFRLSAY